MSFIDYGLGIMNKKCFNSIGKDEIYDLSSIYKKLAEDKGLAGFEIKNRFYEIGSFEGIEEFKKYINK